MEGNSSEASKSEAGLIFATGISGTIGRHLADNVTALDFDLSSNRGIRDWFSLNGKKLRGEKFLHLAGQVGPSLVSDNPELSNRVNVEATAELAHYFLESKGQKFIFISTSHVYNSQVSPIKESDAISPQNLYGEQKYRAEEKLRKLFEGCPERLLILRVFSILDFDAKPLTLGGLVFRSIENNNSVSISNSNDIRDFLTPRSVARALLICSRESNLDGTFNLSSGIGMTVRQAVSRMFDMASKYYGKVEFIDTSMPTVLIGDNSKIKSKVSDLDRVLIWQPSLVHETKV